MEVDDSTIILESPNKLLGPNGAVVKYANVPPNLDPTFFFGMPRGGNITTGDIDRHPYRHHPWTHACAWTIARNLSRCPMILVDPEKKSRKVKDTWGILDRFNSPNPYMTYSPFFQLIILNLVLPSVKTFDSGGQVFITPRKAQDGPGGHCNLIKGEVPDVMLLYNDDHIRPKKDNMEGGMQRLIGWEFYVSGRNNLTELYMPEEIIRIFFANPYDMLSGISMYEPARMAMLNDIKSDIYNTRIFDNNGIPAGIIKAKQNINKQQRRDLYQAWMEEYGGSGNAGKVAVMGNDSEYQALSQSPKDMEYKLMKEDSFDKMLASFGLNKIAMGKYEQINYATIQEGRRILWEDNYIPIGDLCLEPINHNWIQYVTGGRAVLKLDTTSVDALKHRRHQNVMTACMMVNVGLPVSLAYEICDVPLPEDAESKYPWLFERPQQQSALSGLGGLGGTSGTGRGNTDSETPEKVVHPKVGIIRYMAEKIKIADIFIARVFEPAEASLQKALQKFFYRQRNAMQDKVDKWLHGQKAVVRHGGLSPDADAFELSSAEEDDALMELLQPFVKDQMKRVATNLHDTYSSIQWDVTDSKVSALMKKRLREVHQINGTTNDTVLGRIKDAIQQATDNNETVAEMARGIKDAIGEGMEVRRNQSMMIARTETGIVTGQSQNQAYEENGVEFTEWVTANDEHVRDSHQEQGQEGDSIQRLGEKFQPTDLSFPGDPTGEPKEIINCRCTTVPVADADGGFYE
jgi:SPP1 gp7 family putative phage head morphogenesis protein